MFSILYPGTIPVHCFNLSELPGVFLNAFYSKKKFSQTLVHLNIYSGHTSFCHSLNSKQQWKTLLTLLIRCKKGSRAQEIPPCADPWCREFTRSWAGFPANRWFYIRLSSNKCHSWVHTNTLNEGPSFHKQCFKLPRICDLTGLCYFLILGLHGNLGGLIQFTTLLCRC